MIEEVVTDIKNWMVKKKLKLKDDKTECMLFGTENTLKNYEQFHMDISLKLESIPTLYRSAFLPAETTITRRVVATIEVASSAVHREEYCFRGLRTIAPFRPPSNWLESLYRHSRKSPATDELALVPRGADLHLIPR